MGKFLDEDHTSKSSHKIFEKGYGLVTDQVCEEFKKDYFQEKGNSIIERYDEK